MNEFARTTRQTKRCKRKNYGARKPREPLLEKMCLEIGANEGVENREDVPAILDDAREEGALFGDARAFAIPASEDGGGDLDVAAQLVRRMPA